MSERDTVSPVVLLVGETPLMLSGSDVAPLLRSVQRLRRTLATSLAGAGRGSAFADRFVEGLDRISTLLQTPPSLTSPPGRVVGEDVRVLRKAIDDLVGYQGGELTPGLRELGRVLDAAGPPAA